MRHLAWLVLLGALACPARAAEVHAADRNSDYVISLPEILRVIQFYTSGGYQCATGTEDGYGPGAGSLDCGAHDADYAPEDGRMSVSEILRLVQAYSFGSYFACAEGEDGFCVRHPVQRPNFLFVLLDTLRGDLVGKRRDGALVMPFLTEFAAESTYFSRAWSASAWTRPSMTSIHSGLYPNRFKVDLDAVGLNQTTRYDMGPEVDTLTEWLNRYGYDPWAVITNLSLPEASYVQGLPQSQLTFLNGGPAAWVTDDMLAQRPKWKAPFFAYAHYMDAHGPYTPLRDVEYPFAPEPELTGTDAVYLDYGFWRNYTRDLLYAFIGAAPREYEDLSPIGVAVLQSRYDRDCYNMDLHLRRLIEGVLAEHPNTYVVITSDHGDSFFDRGPMIGHGHSLYEEQIHVPLIFHGPGIPAQTIERRVSHMSILPTLARLLEISPEPQWEGNDLLNDTANEPVFAYTRSTFLGTSIDISAVVDGDLKLIDDPTKYGPLQLYDLGADPGELNNIAESRPADVQRLKALLDAHRAAVAPPT